MTFDKLDKTFDIDSAIEKVEDTSTEIKKLSELIIKYKKSWK